MQIGKLTVALGHEELGSDGTSAVSAPLATLHAFQGWADKFLTTPAAGIADAFLRLAYRHDALGPFAGLVLESRLHDFGASAGAADYGDELDIALVARTERMSWTLKYASYSAATLFTDTDKLWLAMDYAFYCARPRARKRVVDQRGESYRYAKLVIATGSRPRVRPGPRPTRHWRASC